MSVVVFVGFGELAASLAEGLGRSGRHELRAYLRGPRAPGSIADRRLADTRVHRCAGLSEAISGADAVFAAVPGSVSIEVASRCAPLLDPDTLYVDLASAAPRDKVAACERITAAGGRYVDAAVLGTVLVSGYEVPMLASGPGADAFQLLVEPDGLRVTAIDGPVGGAALVKLLRGVYLKGRDALIVEMMLAARRHGLADVVAASIDVPSERVPFTALAERVLCSLAVHAERRAAELAASSEVVRDAGIDPALTRAGADTLRGVTELGLAELFGGERPSDARAVLEAIDNRYGERNP